MNKVYCCYPGGKHKALTMSYDDGKVQDRRLIEIFNRYGIRGTFHLNSGLFDRDERIDPAEIPTLYAGHEVACHTVTHPTIARCPLPEVAREVLDDRAALEKYTGYPVRGLSYPNGSLSREIEELLPACGIRYSRVVGNRLPGWAEMEELKEIIWQDEEECYQIFPKKSQYVNLWETLHIWRDLPEEKGT